MPDSTTRPDSSTRIVSAARTVDNRWAITNDVRWAIASVSASLEGYLLCNMHWYERILAAAGGLLLIVPGLVTDAAGLGLVALVVLLQFIDKRKVKAAATL